MPKKLSVRALIDSQHVKGSQRLLKSSRQYFCHIVWSRWKGICSKNSVLVGSEILRQFVNILTPDDKYSLSVKAKLERNQFKCNYRKIKKSFLYFLLHFSNLHLLWNTLETKMSLRGDFFLKLKTAKSGVT